MKTKKKVLAIFGAGPGLGSAIARRFGREGYAVALVARRAGALEERVVALREAGIEAAAFPADLTESGRIPSLLRDIEATLGAIDVAVYAPLAPEAAFVPAIELDAAKLRPLAELFTFAPIELAHALLPGLLERGGAFLYGNGTSSFRPIPGMSGLGPAMAAARNFVFSLHAETKDKGVYAGVLTIGALIQGSAAHAAYVSHGGPMHAPTLDPETIADEAWSLVTQRDRLEVVLPG
jgi:short-subunit dehydrogenase